MWYPPRLRLRGVVHASPQLTFGLITIVAALAIVTAELSAQSEPRVLAPGRRATSEFRLFGGRDFAVSGLRLPGHWQGCTDNSSNLTTATQCWDNLTPGALSFTPNWFDIFFYWATPPSEWRKHTAAVPSLANAAGRGYTMNAALSQFRGELLPHDGTLGPFHSGALSTADGGCRDFTASGIRADQPLLAASDCPPTWGTLGWQGAEPVDGEGYLRWADRVGDAAFAFDPWAVPAELHRGDEFLGTFQTYGFFSDYSSETLFGSSDVPGYGNVIPEAAGGDPTQPPERTGWPLGLFARMDAFSVDDLELGDVGWFQIQVTNRSRELYGVGLDYDSLYMGVLPGWLMYEGGGSLYRDPAHGVVRGSPYCTSTDCGGDRDPMHPAAQWGTIPPNGVGAGFFYGAAAIVVLKSPIGDLRNKKFTDPASPFFMRGDPAAWDDTITFNHGHNCGFHGCSAVTWNAAVQKPPIADTDYEQRQVGMVSSVTSDVLGRRTLGEVALHTKWDTWRWEEFPDATQLDFNKWMPGGWDHDEDGQPDTLYFDDCSGNSGPQYDPVTGHSKPCAVAWSDTLAGGFGNLYSNRGAVVGAGPFRLPADSSVGWVIALVHGNDSLSVETGIAAVLRHYMSFYSRPSPPPPPAIASVELSEGGEEFGVANQPEARVTLYLDATAEDWEDPFLVDFLERLLTADVRTNLGKLRALNPTLEDTLRALVSDNVAAVHVFRSCDGGRSFTSDDDCAADPARDGKFAGPGWFPWRTLEPGELGSFANVVSDEAVLRGESYLYSVVAETRGLSVPVLRGEPDSARVLASGDTVYTCVRDCRTELLDLAPSLLGRIETDASAPSVASVYVPASFQAGAAHAQITLIEPSPDHIPFTRLNVRPTAEEVRDDEYELLFADSAGVTEVSSVLDGSVQQVEVSVFDGDDPTRFTAPTAVAVAGDAEESVTGNERRREWRLTRLSAVLLDGDGTPIMATSELSGGRTVPTRYFGLSNFPGFTLSIDNTLGGQFAGQRYLGDAGQAVGPLVEPAVTFRPEAAEAPTEGRYRVIWTDEAFGPQSPFRLDHSDPDGVRDRVVASLEARQQGTTAAVTPDIVAFTGIPESELLPARMPFRIEDVTDPESPQALTVVLPRSGKLMELQLGVGDDTLFVPVPEREWVPGDRLMLLRGSGPGIEFVFHAAVVACDSAVWQRVTCNPLQLNSPGATGYIATAPGQVLELGYYQTITASTGYRFAARSAVRGPALLNDRDRIRAALDSVKVVPNPLVLFSRYTESPAEPIVLFTHVPPRGVLRIFTLAGQFVQQLRWEPQDLNGQGDLRFNLVTHEGNAMAGGLYLYVLTALDEGGRSLGTAKGKFVVIR